MEYGPYGIPKLIRVQKKMLKLFIGSRRAPDSANLQCTSEVHSVHDNFRNAIPCMILLKIIP